MPAASFPKVFLLNLHEFLFVSLCGVALFNGIYHTQEKNMLLAFFPLKCFPLKVDHDWEGRLNSKVTSSESMPISLLEAFYG